MRAFVKQAPRVTELSEARGTPAHRHLLQAIDRQASGRMEGLLYTQYTRSRRNFEAWCQPLVIMEPWK